MERPRRQRRAAPLREFERAVERVVRAIPRGQVSSYSQVAARAGRPSGARAVARALKHLAGDPWWRVIRSDGTMAPEVAAAQASKLRGEGVDRALAFEQKIRP